MKNPMTMGKLVAILVAGWCGIPGSLFTADLPPHFGVVTVPAQPLPCTLEAVADFDALFAEQGAKGPLVPASVRVVGPDGVVLPTKFEPDANAPGRGTVRWNVPAMPDAQNVEFKVCFAGPSDRKWKAFQTEQVGPENLLPNGGIEEADPDDKHAAYWVKGGERLVDPRLAHSGESCLKLLPRKNATQSDPYSHAQTPGQPGVVVDENKDYTFRYWVRTDGAEGKLVKCMSQLYWYKEDKTYIKHEGLASVRGSNRWTEESRVRRSPPGACYAMVDIFFDGEEDQFYLDDLSIIPVQRLTVAAPKTALAKESVSAASHPGIKRFDFGLDTAVWPKFEAVTPKTAYSRERGFGWTAPANFGVGVRPLPDDLARDFILAEAPATFAVDLTDGRYLAWFLIGDNGLGGSIVPTHVNWSIKADGTEILRYRPDAKTFYEQVVFRNLNDWWAPGVDVYARFIAPQYAEKQAAIEVKGGQTRFEFSKAPLCAMILSPAALQKDLDADLARLRIRVSPWILDLTEVASFGRTSGHAPSTTD